MEVDTVGNFPDDISHVIASSRTCSITGQSFDHVGRRKQGNVEPAR
jgi:hypothetical protein